MINIQGHIYIEIKIDGNPLGGYNLVNAIALLEGTPVIAPSCMMILNDHSGNLTKELCLTDGNQIMVTVGKTPDDLKTITRQYRLYKVRKVNGQAGPQIQVLAIYDAPAWTTEATRDSYEGTSSQALKAMAEKCKLDYDGPEDFNGRTTKDSQVWLSIAQSRGGFAQHGIAQYGYMDDYSAMYAALTSLGVLKYRNVMDVVATPPDQIKYAFVFNSTVGDREKNKQVYMVAQAHGHSDAGLMNAWQNYGSIQVVHGPTGVTQMEDKVDVKTKAPYLAINDQVAQTVGKAKISYGPLDCGNVHDKFYRADYQNKRQLALFSERVSLLVSDPTEVQLFDPVLYKQADVDPNRPVPDTDIYLVVGKTIYVSGGKTYAERIELVRMSITDKGEATLKSSEPTSARLSSIPDTLVDPSANVAETMISTSNLIGAIVAPIEAAIRVVQDKAAVVLNNAKLTLPSLTGIAMNIDSYATYPQRSVQNLTSGMLSLNQLQNTYSDFQSSLDTVMRAVRDGNVALAAAGVSSVARTALVFRPNGIAENLSAMFGVTQVMNETAAVYGSIGATLSPMRSSLETSVGAGQLVDSYVSGANNIVRNYASNMNSIASGYNSLIQTVTGETPNLATPNMDLNRYYLQDMIAKSVAPVTSPIDQITAAIPDVGFVQQQMVSSLTVRDDSRNYQWAPESGYVYDAISPTDLTAKVLALGTTIDNAALQADDYAYTKSVS